jgi:hypothetical protein
MDLRDLLMRALSGMGPFGRLLLWGSGACLLAVVFIPGGAKGGFGVGAIVLAITGFTFWMFGRAMGRVSGMTTRLQRAGLAGMATIVAVGDTGVTVNNDPVVKFALDVVVGRGIPYRVETRQLVSRVLMGSVVAGTRVAVRVDPDRKDDVAIDWSQPTEAGASSTPVLTGGKVGSAAELLAKGKRGTAIITAMQDMGDISDLGYVKGDATGADDRMFIVQLEVKLPGREAYQATVGHRVPERLVGKVGPRTTVDVAVGRSDDQEVAIDWDSVTGA